MIHTKYYRVPRRLSGFESLQDSVLVPAPAVAPVPSSLPYVTEAILTPQSLTIRSTSPWVHLAGAAVVAYLGARAGAALIKWVTE